ncbi:MAG: hypothetical protein FWH18_07445 [Marinilabiliaceae bacterium]|nr:hypothetical protein [Marinilabiliaceae bacterium]
MKYRIYLDNCCFNRPYDDQSQTLLLSEPFNYTEWRRDNLFTGMSVAEISRAAEIYCENNP